MLFDILYRFAGADRQILARMSSLPVEQRGVAAAGAYQLLLGLLSGMSVFYLVSLALDASKSGLIEQGWALVIEIAGGAIGFFLVWNSYRLMLLSSFTQADEVPDAIRDVSRGFVKIMIASLYGAIFGVPVALALSASWHQTSVGIARAPAETQLTASLAAGPEDLLLADYLERQRLRRALDVAVATAQPSDGVDLLRKHLQQTEQAIRAGYRVRLDGIEATDLPGPTVPGIVTRLETLAQHDPLFLGFTMTLFAFFYGAPVLVAATRRKGVYDYLKATQDIRCVAAAGIVPRAAVIPGFRGHTEYVRHRFLRAEQLLHRQVTRIEGIERDATRVSNTRRAFPEHHPEGG